MTGVGTDFITVMKISMIAGRAFTRQDTETSPKVAIIDQALARKFFPHQNPIGKRFSRRRKSDKDTEWTQIIGVCADIRYAHLRQDPPPLFLTLYRQQKEAGSLTYIVRTSMKPEAIVPSLRTAVQQIDPDLPLMDVRTQIQQIDADLQQERMFASLTCSFGVLAITLACVGLYGIMAYTVAQRTNEIGIRLALGAKRRQVRGMVLREVGWLTAMGVVTGLAVAFATARAVKSMLWRAGRRPVISRGCGMPVAAGRSGSWLGTGHPCFASGTDGSTETRMIRISRASRVSKFEDSPFSLIHTDGFITRVPGLPLNTNAIPSPRVSL